MDIDVILYLKDKIFDIWVLMGTIYPFENTPLFASYSLRDLFMDVGVMDLLLEYFTGGYSAAEQKPNLASEED